MRFPAEKRGFREARGPRSNKRCFSDWCVQRAQGTEMPENSGVSRHSLSLGRGFALSQAEVRNLKNTVWKTPFGILLEIHFILPALLQKPVGDFLLIIPREIGRNFAGLFGPTKKKAQMFGGKLRSLFRKKIRSSNKKTFVQNSLCRRATLTFHYLFPTFLLERGLVAAPLPPPSPPSGSL